MTVFPQVDYVCIVHYRKSRVTTFLCGPSLILHFLPLIFANVKEPYIFRFYASLGPCTA